jgi:hypothetical protein
MSSIVKRFFPDTYINTINASGSNLTAPKKGTWVEIHKNETGNICGAEVYDNECEEYAELGLWIENNKLVDYDGAFELPNEVTQILIELGIDCEYVQS